MSRVMIGVDVCQAWLDAYVRPAEVSRRFANTPEGIAELIAWAKPYLPDRILFESTGALQMPAVLALLAEGLPAVVVNARQVRDFAKGLGRLAKTDALDAALLARFGEVVPTTLRPLEAQEIRDFRALCDRRSQLVRLLAIEKNHRHAAAAAPNQVRESIDRHVQYLAAQIAELEDRLDALVESTAAFQAKDQILRSITGIGPQVSRTLLAHLPELGSRSRQAIAALVGLAPYNDDSGRSRGARHIRGGRRQVRLALYQAAVAAVRHCRHMKTFYANLKTRGKASKVALVAVARKLLVLANALLRTNSPYRPPANSVCSPTT